MARVGRDRRARRRAAIRIAELGRTGRGSTVLRRSSRRPWPRRGVAPSPLPRRRGRGAMSTAASSAEPASAFSSSAMASTDARSSSEARADRTVRRFGVSGGSAMRRRPSRLRAEPLAAASAADGDRAGRTEDRVDQIGLAHAGRRLDADRTGDRVQLLAVLAVEDGPVELLGAHGCCRSSAEGCVLRGRVGPAVPVRIPDGAEPERQQKVPPGLRSADRRSRQNPAEKSGGATPKRRDARSVSVRAPARQPSRPGPAVAAIGGPESGGGDQTPASRRPMR